MLQKNVPVHLQLLVDSWWQFEAQFVHGCAECNNWCLLQDPTMDTHSWQTSLYQAIRNKGKSIREMKKDVGMTTAQKSKETRRMEMGSIIVLYIQPTIPTYTYITAL